MNTCLCTSTSRTETAKLRINIETAEVVENAGLKPADLKKAIDAVKQYREEFVKAWNEYFDED